MRAASDDLAQERGRFYGSLTQAEIGQRLGISQLHVSRLLARTLAYLRRQLTSEPAPSR